MAEEGEDGGSANSVRSLRWRCVFLPGWSGPLLLQEWVCASALCLRCAFMLFCTQKNSLRCHPICNG